MNSVKASVNGLSADWRVEFNAPPDGEDVRVALYRNGERVTNHDVRWYHKTEHGSYLANYSRVGLGVGLFGTPLFTLSDLCREQLGIVGEE
jgi:hypothetical protein